MESRIESRKSWISPYRDSGPGPYITSCPEGRRTTNDPVGACIDHRLRQVLAPGAPGRLRCLHSEAGNVQGSEFLWAFCCVRGGDSVGRSAADARDRAPHIRPRPWAPARSRGPRKGHHRRRFVDGLWTRSSKTPPEPGNSWIRPFRAPGPRRYSRSCPKGPRTIGGPTGACIGPAPELALVAEGTSNGRRFLRAFRCPRRSPARAGQPESGAMARRDPLPSSPCRRTRLRPAGPSWGHHQ